VVYLYSIIPKIAIESKWSVASEYELGLTQCIQHVWVWCWKVITHFYIKKLQTSILHIEYEPLLLYTLFFLEVISAKSLPLWHALSLLNYAGNEKKVNMSLMKKVQKWLSHRWSLKLTEFGFSKTVHHSTKWLKIKMSSWGEQSGMKYG
jgi:hypothetical protein